MVDGQFGLHYVYYNYFLFLSSMVDSKVHEESLGVQFEKRSNNLQYSNDISKCVHCDRGKKRCFTLICVTVM